MHLFLCSLLCFCCFVAALGDCLPWSLKSYCNSFCRSFFFFSGICWFLLRFLHVAWPQTKNPSSIPSSIKIPTFSAKALSTCWPQEISPNWPGRSCYNHQSLKTLHIVSRISKSVNQFKVCLVRLLHLLGNAPRFPDRMQKTVRARRRFYTPCCRLSEHRTQRRLSLGQPRSVWQTGQGNFTCCHHI